MSDEKRNGGREREAHSAKVCGEGDHQPRINIIVRVVYG
jgi:hypothetical protein